MGGFDHRHHKASFSSTHNPMNRHLVGMLARASPSCTLCGSRASNHAWPQTEGGKEEVSTTLVCHSKGTLRHPSCWLRWCCDPKEQHNTARHHQETAKKQRRNATLQNSTAPLRKLCESLFPRTNLREQYFEKQLCKVISHMFGTSFVRHLFWSQLFGSNLSGPTFGDHLFGT